MQSFRVEPKRACLGWRKSYTYCISIIPRVRVLQLVTSARVAEGPLASLPAAPCTYEKEGKYREYGDDDPSNADMQSNVYVLLLAVTDLLNNVLTVSNVLCHFVVNQWCPPSIILSLSAAVWSPISLSCLNCLMSAGCTVGWVGMCFSSIMYHL